MSPPQRYGWHGVKDEMLQKNIENAVQRYPWLKDVKERSVTEFEFLHGHLNSPGKTPSILAFRNKVGYQTHNNQIFIPQLLLVNKLEPVDFNFLFHTKLSVLIYCEVTDICSS